MKNILKRVVAYFIDFLIITILVSMITSVDKINFQYKNYQKYNNKYTQITENRITLLKKNIDLERKYNAKKIKKSKYNEIKKKYNNKLRKLETESNKVQYKISRNSIIIYIIYIAFFLGYFGIFQTSFNGQTLGKRIMKLKVIDKYNNMPKMWQLLLRTFILFNLWLYIVNIIFVQMLPVSKFVTSTFIVNEISYTLQLITLLMIVFSKSNRGLHDIIAGTKVIECSNQKESFSDKIVEAEIIKKTKKGDK